MRELLQDEIDRCQAMIDKYAVTHQTKTWSKTIAICIKRDIALATKAIEERDDSAMFRSLRALRGNNLL